jgi:hypothetical protein
MPQASRVIRIVRCNGCGRLKDEVTYMIAGPHDYMCDRCVGQAARQLTPRRPPVDAVRCRFCRQLRSKDEVTNVGSATVCVDCLGVMEGVLAEAEQASRPAT